MRKLSGNYINQLKSGFLSGITQIVVEDIDLDLQIRKNYLNIYFKGNSLLKLSEVGQNEYRIVIDKKFLTPDIPQKLVDNETTTKFIKQVPLLKENIIRYGKSSLEIEYEQLIIRANNYERHNNTEYFILDRQYTTRIGRFDLIGIYWDRNKRRKKQTVPLCFIEIKFALNKDIKNIDEQISRYYGSIKDNTILLAEEMKTILDQKLQLGLIDQPRERLEALQTLEINTDIKNYQFILVLVDYNPYSQSLNLGKLESLIFADQLKIFYGGFGMWERNMSSYPNLSSGK